MKEVIIETPESGVITIPRTGKAALVFTGKLLSHVSTKAKKGPCATRWYELALWQTKKGKFVARVAYNTTWDREFCDFTVEVVDDTESVKRFFQEYDPFASYVGFPISKQYEEREKEQRKILELAYDTAVGGILSHPLFAENID